MINERDIRTINVTPVEMSAWVRPAAARWTRPGASSIRTKDQRSATLATDALVGMVGQYAGLKYLYGAGCIERFVRGQSREGSDQGHDIENCSLDFKSSLRKSQDKPLLSYRLAIRPKERRAGWCYVLGIVDLLDDAARVHLLGWSTAEMLPAEPENEGVFSGAFVLPAKELHPLPPLRWRYFGVTP